MQVNGQSYPHRDGLTLHALLEELQIDRQRVAVAHNDEFYPGAQVPDVPLSNADLVEIVRIVGGG